MVLAGEENADASDAHAMRVVLSLCGIKEGLRGHIVVELSDVDSDQLVKVSMVIQNFIHMQEDKGGPHLGSNKSRASSEIAH